MRRALAPLLALLLLPDCTCASLGSEEAQMEQVGRDTVRLTDLPFGEPARHLAIHRVSVSHLVAQPFSRPPKVIFTIDLDGSLELAAGRTVEVGVVGVERLGLVPGAFGWTATNPRLPALAATLSLLTDRALREARPVSAWRIRLEPERVEVAEEQPNGGRTLDRFKWADGRLSEGG